MWVDFLTDGVQPKFTVQIVMSADVGISVFCLGLVVSQEESSDLLPDELEAWPQASWVPKARTLTFNPPVSRKAFHSCLSLCLVSESQAFLSDPLLNFQTSIGTGRERLHRLRRGLNGFFLDFYYLYF